jgi:hypothetical protein
MTVNLGEVNRSSKQILQKNTDYKNFRFMVGNLLISHWLWITRIVVWTFPVGKSKLFYFFSTLYLLNRTHSNLRRCELINDNYLEKKSNEKFEPYISLFDCLITCTSIRYSYNTDVRC